MINMIKTNKLQLRKLAVFPLILGAGLFLRAATQTAVELRADRINRNCMEYLDLSQTKTYFDEVRNEMGLESESI